MKSRIIQTRFWDDEFVSSADLYTQHLYIYLLTSQYINISGMFQLPENKVKFESKLTDKQFQDAKEQLALNRKVFFFKGWVYVVNALKNNTYRKSEDNEKAYIKELSRVPEDIALHFKNLLNDSSVYSTVTVLPTVPINHKQETINNKQEIINQKTETEEILEYFNLVHERELTSVVTWEDNFKFWRGHYTMNQIKAAIEKWKADGWIWKLDKPRGLELLFAQSNKAGKCDYIGELLDRKQSHSSRRLSENEYLDSEGNIRVRRQNA